MTRGGGKHAATKTELVHGINELVKQYFVPGSL